MAPHGGVDDQAPYCGDPNQASHSDAAATKRYVPIDHLVLPVRPESSISNISSRGSDNTSTVSREGSARLQMLNVARRQSCDPEIEVPSKPVVLGDCPQFDLKPLKWDKSRFHNTNHELTPTANDNTETVGNYADLTPVDRSSTNAQSSLFELTPVRGRIPGTGDPFTSHQNMTAPSDHRAPGRQSFIPATTFASASTYGGGRRDGYQPNTVTGNSNGKSNAYNGTRRAGINPSRRLSQLPVLHRNYQHGINQAQSQSVYQAQHQMQRHTRRYTNPVNTYSQPIPLRTPLAPSQEPVVAFAGSSRERAAALADLIKSGAYDDGQPLSLGAHTPSGDARRRSHSVQSSTPNHDYRDRAPYSFRSGETLSGMQMIPYNSSPTRSGPTAGTMTGRLLPGEVVKLPGWYLQGMLPSLSQAMVSMPLSDPFHDLRTPQQGVVKLDNLPYAAPKNEILAVLGSNASIMHMPEGSPYFEVHIIVDRHLGKSQCAFVVVSTTQEAHRLVSNMKRRVGRGVRIGDRDVQAEVSTQEALMSALFPHATNVEWCGSTPRVLDMDPNHRPEALGRTFTGFLGSEELAMLAKNAAEPVRSAFVLRTPHRIYESMISTLHKFPWHTPQYISLETRKKIYDTVRVCVRALAHALKTAADLNEREAKGPGMNVALFQELVIAALGCPGFSEQQKAALVSNLTELGYCGLMTGHGMNVALGGLAPYSANWPFLALCPKALVDPELVKFYAALVAQATHSRTSLSSLFEVSNEEVRRQPFGNLTINYQTRDLAGLTLAKVAKIERDTVRQVIHLELVDGLSEPFELEA